MARTRTPLKQRAKEFMEIIQDDGVKKGIQDVGTSLRINSYINDGLYKRYLEFQADDGVVCRDIEGNDMLLPISDPGISLGLLTSGSREEEIVDIWNDILDPGMTVIEVGANIGYYSLKASSHIGSSGQLYAFEPVPQNAEILRENLDLNNCSNVKVIEQAIADKTGEIKMTITTHSNRGTIVGKDTDSFNSEFFAEMDNITDKVITVPTTTVDAFTKARGIDPDVIRMDIEGGELKAIKGMQETLDNQTPPSYLLTELHTNFYNDAEDKLMELFDPILNSGYQVKTVELPDQMIKSPTRAEAISNLADCNKYSPHVLFEKQ